MLQKNVRNRFPDAIDKNKVGKYDLEAFSGGGYFYDHVLEYRVWYKNETQQYCYSTATYDDAVNFYNNQPNADVPVVLVQQLEYVSELATGKLVHIQEPRMTEWRTEWLYGNQGTKSQIPKFLKSHDN